MSGISKRLLSRLYSKEKKSSSDIATLLKCSENKINYWLKKYRLPKRSISEAIYLKRNPNGDPFTVRHPLTTKEALLYGLGLGLYWGEGNKRNKNSVRIGNTDVKLLKKFIEFMKYFYNISPEKFRFGLQIFSDMSPRQALKFWTKGLGVSPKQFGKIIVTKARGLGTYREKTKHGVVTIYVSNTKLRNILCAEIEKL